MSKYRKTGMLLFSREMYIRSYILQPLNFTLNNNYNDFSLAEMVIDNYLVSMPNPPLSNNKYIIFIIGL